MSSQKPLIPKLSADGVLAVMDRLGVQQMMLLLEATQMVSYEVSMVA
jgi:hypothetical protein